MKTLTSYSYESWMCTDCGLRNPMLDPVCNECGECQPSTVRKMGSRQQGTGKQRAKQIQNNVNYNNMQMVFEPEEQAPIPYSHREPTPMEKSLIFGANLITWVSLWIITLVALFITAIVVLGMYKAFS